MGHSQVSLARWCNSAELHPSISQRATSCDWARVWAAPPPPSAPSFATAIRSPSQRRHGPTAPEDRAVHLAEPGRRQRWHPPRGPTAHASPNHSGPDRRTALGPAPARRSMDARGTLARLVNGSSALRGRLDALLTVDGPLVRDP